ncbi:formimidoylglutamate deiminase [Neoroseomonas lacus]|uniref:Formimidoylglutamate deiminase n=2 Tax=Neoroseomonas lacus TaxID=287609 RepID=A0A917KZ34_9PROT|nr:formimidoylglutamate deiminase [Neoroseomonas lacus]
MRSMVFAEALLPEGWRHDVRIDVDALGRIASVTPDAAPGRLIALPGLPNLHSHAFQRGMAGLTEHAGDSDDSFWTWRELMYRFLAHLTPEDVEAIATLAYAEMLEGGFTRVGEFHYLHHDPAGSPFSDRAEMATRIAAAADATGISLTLLPCFYAHGEIGGAPPMPGQRRFINDLDGFAALVEGSRRAVSGLAGATLGLAPHSLRAATIEEIRSVACMAQPWEPLHIHVAEQAKEVEAAIRVLGMPPMAVLLEAGLLSPRWCLIHATHATERELADAARAGAIIGLCPVTESNLGDGVFAMPGFRATGGRFGVGTDSNVLISAATELRTLEYSQRLGLRARNVLAPRGGSTGRALWQGAVEGGSQALAAGSTGFAPGAWADIVIVDGAHPAFVSRSGDRLLDSLIFAARASTIHEVWVRGTRVVENGVHPRRADAERRFAAILARILAA